ncbi:MAG: formate dehydrogenase accessory sulfurtransferase FdhD [Bacteroidetes bacterium]|nr:MAG: formate dehydrogenase accessory sulfurtransferase FdhD [Bacteroidota bacterium]
MDNVSRVEILKFSSGKVERSPDWLVREEPLEIRVGFGGLENRRQKSVSVTMRTPGNDPELAAGFLFTEGIIQSPDDVLKMEYVSTFHKNSRQNILKAELAPTLEFDLQNLERHFYTASGCGVCGKASIEAVFARDLPACPPMRPIFRAESLLEWPQKLLDGQKVFESTGGLHAAALFDTSGEVLSVREDIGRHNAVDKLIGAAFLEGRLPLSDCAIVVSGRAGFELVQKSVRAGIPVMVAVGAPSSLSFELAQEAGMTLVGFARKGRFNVYSHPERIDFGA